jgi:transcription antitermination factor NusB
MKTATDSRHKTRISRVQSLFAATFNNVVTDKDIAEILLHKEEIDKQISVAAPEWPLAKINKLDLAVLRQAVFELLYTNTPSKVVIDEAVEIAKTYGSDNSGSFVNGVLGTILEKKTHE